MKFSQNILCFDVVDILYVSFFELFWGKIKGGMAMLIRFSVENFLSYKERQTLDLRTVKTCKEHVENNTFTWGDAGFLKSAVIYGANASGKSNLFTAISTMRRIIRESAKESQSTEDIPAVTFAFSKDYQSKPTLFEIEFICKETQFRYGFSVNKTEIVSEWLLHIKQKTKETPLFYRINQNNEDTIQVFEDMTSAHNKGLEALTRKNALFLSVCDQMNVELAHEIMAQLGMKMNIISGLYDVSYLNFTIDRFSDGTLKEDILGFIRNADFNICDLQVDLDEKKNYKDKTFKKANIVSVHNLYDKDLNIIDKIQVPFNDFESEGTKKAFALAGPIIDTLKNGKILLIDELDSRLHPILTRKIVQMFNSQEQNPNNAQLIFATHDANLLDNKLFRRDQIWFTEKNHGEATELYSLIDFIDEKMKKPRNDASYGKDYLNGRYGAIPFLGDLKVFGENHE